MSELPYRQTTLGSTNTTVSEAPSMATNSEHDTTQDNERPPPYETQITAPNFGHDIDGLRKQITVNAAYIFPSRVSSHRGSERSLQETFDIVVPKMETERYQAMLYVRGRRVPSLIGMRGDNVAAALESLLENSCRKLLESFDSTMALKKVPGDL